MAGRAGLCSPGQPAERVQLSESPLPPPGRPFPGQVGVCGKGPHLCWQSVGAHSEQHTGPGHAEPALPSCCLSAAPWGLSPELPAISWGGGGGQVFGRSTGTSLHLHCHTHPTPGKTSPPTKRACPCVQGGPPGHLLPREPPAWAWTEPALGAEVLVLARFSVGLLCPLHSHPAPSTADDPRGPMAQWEGQPCPELGQRSLP